MADKLRSIVAQFEFSHQIRSLEAEGVPFRTYMYVPELHQESQMPFCEREDEAHLLKASMLPPHLINETNMIELALFPISISKLGSWYKPPVLLVGSWD